MTILLSSSSSFLFFFFKKKSYPSVSVEEDVNPEGELLGEDGRVHREVVDAVQEATAVAVCFKPCF